MYNIKDKAHLLQVLQELNLEDDQLIEVLVTLMDDWEVREAVKRCRERRKNEHIPKIKVDVNTIENIQKKVG